MITLKDYIGKIYKEVTNAKVQSDIETLAIAQEYAANPMLKHFSVPNIRIKDMELTIPVAVDAAQTTSATYTEREIQDVYEQVFEKTYLSFYPFKTARLEEMKTDVSQKAQQLSVSAASELSVASGESEIAQPTADTEATRAEVVAAESEQSYAVVLTATATNFAEAVYGLVSSEIQRSEFNAKLIPEIESNLQPKTVELESLPVIIETQRLKLINDPASMITIKINIMDDAMEWTTDVDADGNATQVLNYE